VGLIRDITTVVAEEKVNISSVSFSNSKDTTSTYLTLDVKGLAQLSQLMVRIEGIRGLISVTRVGEGIPVKAHPASPVSK